MDTCALDILSINKTRLNDKIDDTEIKINGYSVIRKDRNRDGGGIDYVKSSISAKVRQD